MSQFAVGYDEADQAAMVALGRARLLRQASLAVRACWALHGTAADMERLAYRLEAESGALVNESFGDVLAYGAELGESYFHEEDGQLCLGWALADADLVPSPASVAATTPRAATSSPSAPAPRTPPGAGAGPVPDAGTDRVPRATGTDAAAGGPVPPGPPAAGNDGGAP